VGEVAERHGRVAGNRFRAALSAYFTWMLREGLTEANPVLGTNKQVEAGARQRRLSDAELAAIWRNAGDDQYGAILRLLMLTACRRDEIGDLCWSEIDLDAAVITLPGAKTKNNREHRVPLSSLALEVLRAQPRRAQSDGTIRNLVFGHRTGRGYGGWSKSKAELDQRLEQAGTPVIRWTLHDFRRSVSTSMHEVLNVQPHVVEAVLNHVSGHKGGVAGVYNVSSYDVQKAVALQKWSDHIEALVTDKRPTATVTKLRRRS
jgi:integrase